MTARSGILTSDEIWSGLVEVDGDLVVPEGRTLVLEAGTWVRFAIAPAWKSPNSRLWRGQRRPVHQGDKCGLLILGRLEARGREGSPVHLGGEHDWGGLHFLGRSTGRLSSLRLERSVSEGVGAWDESGVELVDPDIRGCWTAVGVYGGARAALLRGRLEGARELGLACEGGSAKVRGTVFVGPARAGVFLDGRGTLDIRGGELEGGGAGLVSEGGRLAAFSCRLSNQERAVDLRGAGHRLEGLEIGDCGDGVSVGAGSAALRGLRLRGVGRGIVVWAGGSVEAARTSIERAKVGVAAFGGRASFSDLRCREVRDGLRVEGGADVALERCRIEAAETGALLDSGTTRWEEVALESCGVGVHFRGGGHRLNRCRVRRCGRDWVRRPAAAVDWRRSAPRRGLKDIVRGLVLRTRRAPVLGRLYRLAYAAGVAWFGRWGAREPEVASLSVNRGWVSGDWQAGLSDLDFVVVARGLAGAAGGAWLERFWDRYARGRRWLPFLGEVLIAGPEDAEAYARLGGPRAAEMGRQNRALRGRDPFARPGLPEDARARELERAHAYTRLMHCHHAPDVPPLLSGLQAHKAALDVLRHLGTGPVPSRREFWERADGACREALSPLLDGSAGPARRRLEVARAACAVLRRWHAKAPAAETVPTPTRASGLALVEEARELWRGALSGVFLDGLYRSYLVIDDRAVDGAAVEEGFREWPEFWSAHPEAEPSSLPVLLSRRVWTAWARLPYLENPGLALEWGAEGLGDSGLEGWPRQFRWGEVGRPAEDSRTTRASVGNLLLTWRLLGAPQGAPSDAYVRHYLISRTLGLRLRLEAGKALPFFEAGRLIKEASASFPEVAAYAARLAGPGTADGFFPRHYAFFDDQLARLRRAALG